MAPIHLSATPLSAREEGFTIVEVMVASVVLLVGVLGVLGLLTGALTATARNNQRVGATNVARELLEAARSLDYDDLTPASVAAAVQARGLGSGTPWTITRRGVQYTVTPTVCTYDAPEDKLATTAPSNVCTPQQTGATGDLNGDDFRRLTFRLQWLDKATTRSVTQTELIVNPSGGLGPRITNVAPLTQTITTGTTTATVAFTTSPAAALSWHADDGKSQGVASGPVGTPQVWTVDWPIGTVDSGIEVLDGAYQIIAQAFDQPGVAGDAKLATVVLNRRKPYALTSLAGGHDTRDGDWVDLAWTRNSERDILGYRVYRPGPDGLPGNGNDELVTCAGQPALLPNTASSCVDLVPESTGAVKYFVVAVDRDSADALREGDTRLVSIAAPGAQPAAPAGPLTATTNDSQPTLSWSAPSTGAVAFYRIYRDGTAVQNRIDRTAGSATSWVDGSPGSGSHQYWVTAVDASYNESNPIGPVVWSP